MTVEFCRLTEDYRQSQLDKYLKKYKSDEYNTQAIKFLHETETNIEIRFLNKGKYFSDDKQERNIYSVTLKNEKGVYNFTFGDSIRNTEKFEKTFGSSKSKYRPTPYSILACMMVDHSRDYAEFCDEFGYSKCDENNYEGNFINEASMKVYRAVKEQSENLVKLFDEVQLEALHEIQQIKHRTHE